MPLNGSGQFLRGWSWTADAAASIPITASRMDGDSNDIATALSNAMYKDGQSTPTANIKMGGFKLTNLGAGTASTDAVNIAGVQGGASTQLGSVAGTDTITAAGSPTILTLTTGMLVKFVSAGANTTTSVTLNIDSLGAKAVTKRGSTALAVGDIAAGMECVCVYDGTQFQIINGLAALTSLPWSGITSTPTTLAGYGITNAVDNSSSQSIGGVKTFTSTPIYSAGSGATILGTAVATTSGTAFDFTGIPSWAKRVTISFSGIGTSGVSALMFQIGSGSVDTSSTYSGAGGYIGSGTAQFSNDTNGFLIIEPASSGASTIRRHGSAVFTSMGSNLWVMSGVAARSDSLYGGIGGGSKTLSGALDRVRITTFNGTDTFAAGSVNIIWE